MKYLNRTFLILFIVVSHFFLSCASTPENKTDSVYVMVYDYKNSEIMNVSVLIDDVEIGKTDIYGRLVFPCDIEKEVLVRAQKDDYELVEMKTTIRPGMLLYFRMGNSSYYAESAEKELDKNNLQNALKMIDKALQIDNRQDWNYLKTIIIRRIQHEE